MWCIAQSDVDVEKIQLNRWRVESLWIHYPQISWPDHLIDWAFFIGLPLILCDVLECLVSS